MVSRPWSSDTSDRCGEADDPGYLTQLFDLAEQTVASRADWMPNREEARQSYRGTLEHFFGETDDGFFQTHASVIFFSGLKVSTVEPKLQAIHGAFPDINTVLAYGDERIDALMSNPDLIRNKAKITAVVRNARSFQAIISRHGSFRAYLLSFNEGFPKGVGGSARVSDDLDRLEADLIARFAHFGPASTKHFLTDYGFGFIKPVSHVMRLFYRLGLVETESEGSYRTAVRIGRLMADSAGVPIDYVDAVLASLGMAHKREANVCRKTDPHYPFGEPIAP